MVDFKPRNLHGEFGLFELLFGDFGLSLSFFKRGKRSDFLGVELVRPLVFAAKKLQTRFGRLHRRLVGRPDARERERCGFYAVFELTDNLAFVDEIAAIDIKLRDDADKRIRQFDDLLRLNHALELRLRCGIRPGSALAFAWISRPANKAEAQRHR